MKKGEQRKGFWKWTSRKRKIWDDLRKKGQNIEEKEEKGKWLMRKNKIKKQQINRTLGEYESELS